LKTCPSGQSGTPLLIGEFSFQDAYDGTMNDQKGSTKDKKFGYCIFGGLLIAALLGSGRSANSNPIVRIGIGTLVGAAIGWFAASCT